MKTEYRFGLERRCVSLAARLIDSYTCAAAKGVFITAGYATPIVKPDGYFVFTDLPDGPLEIMAGGDKFFTERITLPVSVEIVDIYLTPRGCYSLSPKSAYVSECLEKGGILLLGRPRESSIRLLEYGTNYIKTNSYNLEMRHLAFIGGDEIIECFVTGERISGRTYALKTELKGRYEAMTAIYPLSFGGTEEDGSMFMPLWGAEAGEKAAMIYNSEDCSFCKAADVKFTR